MYVHTYVYVCMYMYVHTYVCVCMYMYVRTYRYVHTYVCTYLSHPTLTIFERLFKLLRTITMGWLLSVGSLKL